MASILSLFDDQLPVNLFFQLLNVGDNAYQAAPAGKFLQDSDRLLSRSLIQASKALVDKHGVHLDPAVDILDDVCHPQRHGEGCHKGFPAREGLHIPHRIGHKA